MNLISFMTANYVARETGYNMTGGWGHGDRAANEYFEPLETFAERFEALLQEIKAMDFTAIDLWTSHLNPKWATEEHIRAACRLLQQYDLPVVSLAGWFGSTPEEFERTCQLAVAVDCKILAGSTSMLEKDRAFVVDTLKQHDLKLALENHPEKTADEMLQKIGDGGDGTIGTTVDTGWYGTQDYNAAKAIKELRNHLFHIHLKDVLAAGAHETCRFGKGIVPIADCVRVLQEVGYQGGISVEHEPEFYDPTPDVIASRDLLQDLLRGGLDE